MRPAKPARIGGRPLKTVTRTKRGEGYDITVRIRPTMSEAEVEEADAALRQAQEDLHAIPRGERVET